MLKLTKTGIGLLTKQYKSVLLKCLLLNLGLILLISMPIKITKASIDMIDRAGYDEGLIYITTQNTSMRNNGYWIQDYNSNNVVARLQNRSTGGGELTLGDYYGNDERTYLSYHLFRLNNSSYATGIDFAENVTAGTTDASHLTTTGAVNQLLNNYYYTFRVDERVEAIEFALFLDNEKLSNVFEV